MKERAVADILFFAALNDVNAMCSSAKGSKLGLRSSQVIGLKLPLFKYEKGVYV